MEQLSLDGGISLKYPKTNEEYFWALVDASNYTKAELDVLYGRVEKITHRRMDRLLDKAFSIDDHRTIARLCKLYR